MRKIRRISQTNQFMRKLTTNSSECGLPSLSVGVVRRLEHKLHDVLRTAEGGASEVGTGQAEHTYILFFS